jgi:hypothetical protein
MDSPIIESELKEKIYFGICFADPNPGSGAFLTPGSEIRDGKKSGSGMSIPDHSSENLERVFRAKNT